MTEISIPLCIGKPIDGSRATDGEDNIKAATFSRFVLPFAYKIDKISPPAERQKLFYEPEPLDNLSFIKRRKYFSRETALTLYERSIWLDMSDTWQDTPWGKEAVRVTLRGRQFKIGMLPPRIVLFEAATGQQENSLALLSSNKSPQVLHTGFLLVDLYFPLQVEHPELDDLLVLNESFRYFGIPYDEHAELFKRDFGEIPAGYTGTDASTQVKELGKLERYFERWANLLEIPVREGDDWYHLFPGSWAENARRLSYNQKNPDHDNNWLIYADNRCYVWTAALLEKGGETLQQVFYSASAPLTAREYGHWVRLLNVDNPEFTSPEKTHFSVAEFDRNWADERTYKRWQHGGTWYGFCYHCGALIGPAKYLNIFTPYSSYYFDTSLLLFYIRMTLFAFSRKLTNLFQQEQPEDNDWMDSLREMRRQFSRFTILYQFPLLSNQQQSIEMFALNRKHFDIDDFFKEIQQEIDNTHDFLELVEANKLSTAANKLSQIANKLATWGLPLAAGGMVAGIFGMNDFHLVSCRGNCIPWWDIIAEAGVVLVVACMVWLCFWTKGTFFICRLLLSLKRIFKRHS